MKTLYTEIMILYCYIISVFLYSILIESVYESDLEPGLVQKPQQLSELVFKLPQSNHCRGQKKQSPSRTNIMNIKRLHIYFYMIWTS